MNETGDDISYLPEAEVAPFKAPVAPVENVVPPAPVADPGVLERQAATARELIGLDPEHEAFIQQFMPFGGRFS